MWYADADVPERGPDDNPALALYLVPYSGQHPASSAALMHSSVAALTLGCSAMCICSMRLVMRHALGHQGSNNLLPLSIMFYDPVSHMNFGSNHI